MKKKESCVTGLPLTSVAVHLNYKQCGVLVLTEKIYFLTKIANNYLRNEYQYILKDSKKHIFLLFFQFGPCLNIFLNIVFWIICCNVMNRRNVLGQYKPKLFVFYWLTPCIVSLVDLYLL